MLRNVEGLQLDTLVSVVDALGIEDTSEFRAALSSPETPLGKILAKKEASQQRCIKWKVAFGIAVAILAIVLIWVFIDYMTRVKK